MNLCDWCLIGTATHPRRYCSPECSKAARAEQHRRYDKESRRRPQGTCVDCQGPTSHTWNKRCKDCAVAHRDAEGRWAA